MTEPTPTPATLSGASMTAAELDRAIADATREYIALSRAYPRDPQRIAAAKAAIEDLKALRAALNG